MNCHSHIKTKLNAKAIDLPFNYRRLPMLALPQALHFGVAGMASPLYRGSPGHQVSAAWQAIPVSAEYYHWVAHQLSQHGVCHVVCLQETLNDDFAHALQHAGIEYVHTPMPGSTEPGVEVISHTPEALNALYGYLANAVGGVVLHCMGGMGRTGTHLAALLLRRRIELAVEQGGTLLQQLHDDALSRQQACLPSRCMTNEVLTAAYEVKPVACTALVADVVTQLRDFERRQGGRAHFAVETPLQIEALCRYQACLL